MTGKRSASLLILAASLLLVGAGCGQPAPAPSAAQPAAPKNENKAPAAAPERKAMSGDACGNPYYPLHAGFTVTYGVTSAPSAKPLPDYTLSVLSVSGTTATLRTAVDGGITADLTADCADGTVALKGTFDLGSAMQGTKVKTEVLSSSGTFLPKNVAVGTDWKSEQKIRMEMSGGAAAGMGPVTATVATESKAVAKESVTVPAGTFDAVKVEVKRTSTVELSGMPSGMKLPPGMKIPTPPPSTTTTTEWWAKGAGVVKSVTVSQNTTTTVVAKSISGQ